MSFTRRVSDAVAAALLWSPLAARSRHRTRDDGFSHGQWRDATELPVMRAKLSPAATAAIAELADLPVRDANIALGYTDPAVLAELEHHALVTAEGDSYRFTRDGWSLASGGWPAARPDSPAKTPWAQHPDRPG